MYLLRHVSDEDIGKTWTHFLDVVFFREHFGHCIIPRAFCYSQSILQEPILGWRGGPSGVSQELAEKAQNCNLELWGFFSEWSYFLLQRATTRLHQHTLFNFRAIWPFWGGTIWWEQGKVVFDLDLWCAKKSEVHNWTYNCYTKYYS